MKRGKNCYAFEKLIDMVLAQDLSVLPHLTACTDCRSRLKGIKLSWDIAKRHNPLITNEDFKSYRILVIEELAALYG
ncbi:MAG: hypothetical protein WBA74_09930, partial [Cyclobacteriaceae bacterium]